MKIIRNASTRIFIAATALMLTAVLLLTVKTTPAETSKVGMILNVKGKATVFNYKVATRAEPMAHLSAGEIIRTAKNSSITIVMFAGNREYKIGPNSQVKVDVKGITKIEGKYKTVASEDGMKLPRKISFNSWKIMGKTSRLETRDKAGFYNPTDKGKVIDAPFKFVWKTRSDPEKTLLFLTNPNVEDDPKLTPYENFKKTVIETIVVKGNTVEYPDAFKTRLKPGKEYRVIAAPLAMNKNSAPENDRVEAAFKVLPKTTGKIILKNRKRLEKALEKNPDNPAPLIKMARMYLENHMFYDALKTAKRLQKKLPDNKYVYELKHSAYVKMGLFKQASRTLKELKKIK